MNQDPNAEQPAASDFPSVSTGGTDQDGNSMDQYIQHVAQAVFDLSSVQQAWMEVVDAASQQTRLLHDAAWQWQCEAAMAGVVKAAGKLRPEVVPTGAESVQATLDRAQQQASLAARCNASALTSGDLVALVTAAQHLDLMSELIEQASAAIRG